MKKWKNWLKIKVDEKKGINLNFTGMQCIAIQIFKDVSSTVHQKMLCTYQVYY